MNITPQAEAYHEKMFPGYVPDFLRSDPEFIERFDNFAFDEVVNQDDLDSKTRFMAILATLKSPMKCLRDGASNCLFRDRQQLRWKTAVKPERRRR